MTICYFYWISKILDVLLKISYFFGFVFSCWRQDAVLKVFLLLSILTESPTPHASLNYECGDLLCVKNFIKSKELLTNWPFFPPLCSVPQIVRLREDHACFQSTQIELDRAVVKLLLASWRLEYFSTGLMFWAGKMLFSRSFSFW